MHSNFSSSAPSLNPSKLTLEIYDTEPDDAVTSDGKRRDYLKALCWENAQCCDALQAANINPYKHECSGQKKNSALVDERTGERNDCAETRSYQSLPFVAARKRRDALGPLLMLCHTFPPRSLRTAVVTLGAPCTVDDLRLRLKMLFDTLEKFFTSHRRSHPIELLFASAETPVQNDSMSPDDYPPGGGLLYHPHVHIIFRVTGRVKKARWREWLEDFKKAFQVQESRGYIRDCGSLKSVVGACRYVTKLPVIREILNAGEFVHWHQAINNFRLIRAYRSLRAYKASLKERGLRIVAEKEIDGAGPLWRWTYRLVEKQQHLGRKKRLGPPRPPIRNRLKARFRKQDRHGNWQRYAVFENPDPSLSGWDLMARAGLPCPDSRLQIARSLCSL